MQSHRITAENLMDFLNGFNAIARRNSASSDDFAYKVIGGSERGTRTPQLEGPKIHLFSIIGPERSPSSALSAGADRAPVAPRTDHQVEFDSSRAVAAARAA